MTDDVELEECRACRGRGGTLAGPCSDCLGTGELPKPTPLHDCGYVEDTFACKIRHQAVMTGNTEARKHNKELQQRWQEKHYGL